MSLVPASRAATHRVRIHDRRTCPRQRVPLFADVRFSNGRENRSVAVLDISEKGALLETTPAQVLDPNLEINLALAGPDESIHATCVVVWNDSVSRAGIRFSNFHFGATRSLEQWLSHNFLAALNSLPRSTTRFALGSALSSTAIRGEEPVNALGPGIATSLQPIVDGALRLTRSTGAAIAWAHGEEVVCIATAGSSAPPVGAKLQVGSGFSGECIQSARTLHCVDSDIDDRVNRESCRALEIRSMLAVPIVSGNQVYGLLEVFSPEPNHFSSQDEHLLENFAETLSFPCTDSDGTLITNEQLVVEPTPDRPVVRMVIKGNAKTVGVSLASLLKEFRCDPRFANFSSRRSAKIITAVAALAIAAIVWLSWPWTQSVRARLPPSMSQNQASGSGLNPRDASSSDPVDATDMNGLRARAAQGDAEAQFTIGGRYALGKETPQDYGEAALWFLRAAEQGHIRAQSILSSYYEAGIGVPRDLAKAYFWAAVAALGGDASSENRVAILDSKMSRSQVLEAQQQFGTWLRRHPAGVRPIAP
ncbi:MAG: GAF domain-containing protein [Acidobacteriaceae bacterium]|nr:GAF domain-containing protein [Acidobacteriaceae bacterium]